MSTELTFLVIGKPVGQPRHRVSTIGGRGRLYLPKSHPVHAYKAAIKVAFTGVAGDWETITGPVQLSVHCRFAMPNSWSRKKRCEMQGTLHDSKPDADNVVKAVKDALTDAGVWLDDSQVALEFVSKRWSIMSQTEIRIRKCDPGE